MPRALLVSEIFSNVISYVGTHVMYPSALSRRTLLALAVTCRAFSEQALDSLWKAIKNIVPLLRCAGITLPPKNLPQDDDGSIIPTESQLAIINRYAHRVRFLIMCYNDWPRRVQSFLQTLVYSSKVLMPNLRGLVIGTDEFFHLLPPLLGPRLQHLTIYTAYHEDNEADVLRRPALDMVLRSLPSSCPSLESFKVYINNTYGPWDLPSIAPLLSHAIQNLQKLHTVVALSMMITKDALTRLPSSLTSIETQLPAGSDLEDIFGSSRGPFLFENIESVDWWIKEWQDVEDFARLWPRKLTSMSLRSNMVTFDPEPLQVLFDTFHTRDPFRHLQCIHLLESLGCLSTLTKVITIDTIRPLFYLSQLQVLDINTKSSVDIDEQDLEEMADAWPCLEVLLLNKKHGCHPPSPPGVTLRGVVEFVALCPRLTKLCLGITLDYMEKDFDLDMDSILNLEPRRDSDTLEYLMLSHPRSIREDFAERLGMLIEKLFPRVAPFGTFKSKNRYYRYFSSEY
ncbi:hypothetical protein DFH29DRAFT_1078514 [Suillus ampliporus]|nr:hypothetical protein DFH29DRAFT_1078514 [Suillus ampliporus]